MCQAEGIWSGEEPSCSPEDGENKQKTDNRIILVADVVFGLYHNRGGS